MNPDSPQPDPTRYTPYTVADPQYGGMPVFVFDLPAGWQARSQVVWNMQQTSLPVTLYAAAANPEGSEAVEFFPTAAFYWLEPSYNSLQPGQNSGGLIAMPPMKAADAMARLVIPQYRGNRQNLRLVGVQPLPDLLRVFNDPSLKQGQGPVETVVARIEYEESGRAFEEEFFGVHTIGQAQAGSITQINWGFARLFSFRAERGHLEAARPTMWHIVASIRPNPQWQQTVQGVMQQLNAAFQQQSSAFYANLAQQQQLSQQISAQNDAFLQRSAQWRAETFGPQPSAATQPGPGGGYTSADAFDDALLGREAYVDPNDPTGNYHYESGYPQYVWTDNQGSFEASNDPLYDPNIGSSSTWTQAQRPGKGQG